MLKCVGKQRRISVKLCVAAVQIAPKLGNLEENIVKTCTFIEKAVEQGARLIVLPELSNSGYNFKNRQQALECSEPIPNGPTIKEWEKLARRHNVWIIGGINERYKDKLYNSAVILGPEGYVGKYRKLHLFAKEKFIFQPGDLQLEGIKTGDFTFGVMICFDWAFPEVARVLTLKGAEIVCHPANLVLPYGQKAMRIRSLENHIFTITANRVGKEKDLMFTGQSQITDVKGEVLARGSKNKEEIITAEINIDEARNKKITPYNDLLKDRRPEYYSLLATSIR
ncbi:MAG: acyltransferase [Candidatus Odinarchaeota archaeon]|nr:acyltransferase [Candidatus Odinarchaeota archaeon]